MSGDGAREAAILRPGEMAVKDRGGGARTVQLVGRRCGARDIINGITSFDPGAAIPLHFHNCEESVMVIEGEAVFECGAQRHAMRAGDTTWVPPQVPHRFLNESGGTMRIFWSYADGEATRTFVADGRTNRIDAEEA